MQPTNRTTTGAQQIANIHRPDGPGEDPEHARSRQTAPAAATGIGTPARTGGSVR